MATSQSNPRIALVQMSVGGGSRAANMGRAVDRIAEAASRGADIAVLPECLDLGWTHPSSQAGAESVPHGETCRALAEAARSHRILVCAGLTERDGDRVYNAAVLIDRDGALLLRHRKIHELDIGQPFYARGDRLNVAETEFGRIGVMICADANAPDYVLGRALGRMGAGLILSPCAWAVPADHDNAKEPYGDLWRRSYGVIAGEFSAAVIGVSNVGAITAGPWEGRHCIGCSLAIGRSGKEILQAPYGVDAEVIEIVEID